MRPVLLSLLGGLVLGCGSEATTEGPARWASDLAPFGGLDVSEGVALDLDYTDAIDSGFRVPSAAQVDGGFFTARFHLRDTIHPGRRFRYKLYYRNESYHFPELDGSGAQHPDAWENFYGSWENAHEGFRTTTPVDAPGIEVTCQWRIAGDPRDESRYRRNGVRARWARNPRVGEYSVLLVVVPEDRFEALKLAKGVIDIGDTSAAYIEPYWYFLHGPGAHMADVQVLQADRRLTVRAHPDPGAGIAVLDSTVADRSAYCATCGHSATMLERAPFEQFIQYIDPSTTFRNVPVIADVLDNGYTPEDHDRYRCAMPESWMVDARPTTSTTPCATVRADPDRHMIELRNPASTEGHLRKENVAIRSRHGTTYGRYRIRCHLPRLLNDEDMWVGLTNAIWLIDQGAPGNLRRACDGGYMAHYYGGDSDERVPRVAYAEIDFEILCTPPYCPDREFPPILPQQLRGTGDRLGWWRGEPPGHQRDMITVACTNWDMACPEPPDFGWGCHPVDRDGETFLAHRWDSNYRALTEKREEPDSVLFSGPYWFEIDWRPEEILWRIGPDPDHMRLVGYMNSRVTSISNVQMLIVISQEFHNTKWWPGSRFDQGFVPFPARDYVGEVQEVFID
ncbi:MAG: hypothetical protein H6595_06040 [Flavobacteriales bacterium]|nr:hypothetical protein [Flavobacteriales bacterium]MCB9167026.1 hypothetical protein [Flavobacteriales bacterium]